MREVVWPLVLRPGKNGLDILAFRHPLAGLQLVKGGIETGESAQDAGARELWEESGIRATATHMLCHIPADLTGPAWHLVRCETEPLPDTWNHHCLDDGGHDFAFFWHNLNQKPNADWHPVFHKALEIAFGLFLLPGAPRVQS